MLLTMFDQSGLSKYNNNNIMMMIMLMLNVKMIELNNKSTYARIEVY